MSHPRASLVVSVVSAWEMVLKHQAGKLRLRVALDEVLDRILYHAPWTILPVTPEYLSVLAALPMLHRDPFDRLLIAQARHEGMAILTADEQIKRYERSHNLVGEMLRVTFHHPKSSPLFSITCREPPPTQAFPVP